MNYDFGSEAVAWSTARCRPPPKQSSTYDEAGSTSSAAVVCQRGPELADLGFGV